MEFKKGAVNRNKFVILGDIAKIELYNKKYEVVAHAIIDAEDLPTIICRRWKICDGYAVASRPQVIGMHRLILNAPKGLEVDHANRNRLDNRKENIRIASRFENARNMGLRKNNSTGIIGVYFDRRRMAWYSQIHIYGKTIHLGCFDKKEDAIVARIKAEEKYFGAFAPQAIAV